MLLMQSNISFVNIEDSLKKKKMQLVIKKIFDFIFSLLGLIILSPLFLLIAIVIKLDSEGPVLFKQRRVGVQGQIFEILKFRTMLDNAEKLGKQITIGNDARITKAGRVLRKYKLDEFPQLINVLKGDMSLVGPRPEVLKYVELYDDVQKQVLLIRPGITDYASIKYKNESNILAKSSNPEKTYINEIIPNKIELNLKYILELSLITDIKLIAKTILEIIK